MTPAFAVVGHPNKGKSSIVSTIAQNDAIAISPRSGTTRAYTAVPVTDEERERLLDESGFPKLAYLFTGFAPRQFLRLELPPESQIWSVFVDGKAEKPAEAEASADGSA